MADWMEQYVSIVIKGWLTETLHTLIDTEKL
jgi:hypothetical protein